MNSAREARPWRTTARLAFSRITEAHGHELHELDSDPRVMRYIGHGGVRTRDDVDATLERVLRAYALYPVPLRHALSMGEMARYFNAELRIGARLHVVPAAGWQRAQWFDETRLPWVRPSPNLPTLASATVYPALVAFEATNT